MKTTSNKTEALFLRLIFLIALPLIGNAFVRSANAQSSVPPPDGLVNWWDGDAVSGTTAFDIWDGIDGTMVGGVGLVPGMVGQAFSFDGDDDYIDLPGMILSGPFTIDMWWSTESARRHTLIGWGSDNRDYLQFRNNIRYKYKFGNQQTSVYLDYASDGTFYHVALTRDSDNVVRLYHDGNLQDTISINAADFRISNIARNDDSWNIMKGLIDEVEIFNRALSAEEIWAIFNAGSAGKYKMRTVSIDIKPGSYPNSINPNAGGVIPVAILTTETFDASSVDPETIALEGILAKEKGKSSKYGSLEDVDGDGDLDLVVQIPNMINWAADATEATLTGFTWKGIPIEGTDSVRIIP